MQNPWTNVCALIVCDMSATKNNSPSLFIEHPFCTNTEKNVKINQAQSQPWACNQITNRSGLDAISEVLVKHLDKEIIPDPTVSTTEKEFKLVLENGWDSNRWELDNGSAAASILFSPCSSGAGKVGCLIHPG